MLTLSAFQWISLSSVATLCLVNGRIFNRCELAFELNRHDVQWKEVTKWICLAHHATGYNTSFFHQSENSSTRSYGILGISNFWCQDDHADSKGWCHENCTALQDDDILPVLRCARLILDEFGFEWWNPLWNERCANIDKAWYTKGCQERIGNNPVVVLNENGVNAVISCSVRGYPRITNMWWEWNTKWIDIESDEILENFDPHPVDIDYYSNLTIKRVRLDHAKQYTCYAENERESFMTVFGVDVDGATHITDTTLTTEDSTQSSTDSTDLYSSTDLTMDASTADTSINPSSTYTTTDLTTTEDPADPATTDASNDPTTSDASTVPSLPDTSVDPSTTYETTQSSTLNPTEIATPDTPATDTTAPGTVIPSTTSWNTPSSSTDSTTDSTLTPLTSTFSPGDEVVYTFCELAQQLTYLYDDTADWNEHMHTWLCLSETATMFNGSYIGFNSTVTPPIIYYGVFKISNRWCNDIFDQRNPCNVKCEDLPGKALKANALCAKFIQQSTGGFVEWAEYELCKDYPADNLKDCLEPPEFISAGGADYTTYFIESEKDKSITCSVRGYPPPKLIWDEVTLDYIDQSKSRLYIDPMGPRKVEVNGSWIVQYTIFFNTIQLSDERTYRCDATNTVGSATQSNTVKVIVKDPTWRIPLIVGGSTILLLLGLLALALGFLRWRKQKKKHRNLTKIYQQFKYGNQTGSRRGRDVYLASSSIPDYFCTAAEFKTYQGILDLPFSKELEISRHGLHVLRSVVLGMGAFGVVYKGMLGGTAEVAVKTVLQGADEVQLTSLLSEVKIMSYVGRHPNIVQLLGVQTVDLRRGIVYVALEYCSRGSLKEILQQKRIELERNSNRNYNYSIQGYLNHATIQCSTPLTQYQLLTFCTQVCAAMEFLTEKRIIHGDLAARNVLVDANFVSKISDFGLSRQMSDHYKKYIVAPKEISLPWRWLAIETLRHLKFSSASDVWAFGVFMWEIFSLAELPYGASINFNSDFVDYLDGGFRLQMPKYATEEIYELMKRCWENDPVDRITFAEMSVHLLRFVQLEYGTGTKQYRRRGYHFQP